MENKYLRHVSLGVAVVVGFGTIEEGLEPSHHAHAAHEDLSPVARRAAYQWVASGSTMAIAPTYQSTVRGLRTGSRVQLPDIITANFALEAEEDPS